jgi:hypothetical protein
MLTLPSDHAVDAAVARLRASLVTPGLRDAVTAYFAEPAFAGVTFTDLGRNPPDEIVPDDLLAVALLDITWRPHVVRILLDLRRREISALLAAVPADVDLWDASETDRQHVDALWEALTAIDGIGTASATKLLARKRPRMCPISDSVVIKAVDVPGRTWDVLRSLLADAGAREDIEVLRPPAAAGVSLLRILDVALWVMHSRTSGAQWVRQVTGLTRLTGGVD